MSDKPKDNPLAAVGLAALTAGLLATMNLFAKLLGQVFSPVEITFFRNVVALCLVLAGFVLFRKMALMKTSRPLAQFTRAAVGTISLFFTIWSYTLLPLANATALLFTQPLWVVILSYPLLREKVGIYRILAVIAGFSGVLVMADPSGEMGWHGLMVGLMAGFLNACVAICLRWLGQTEHASTTVFYFVFLGLIGTGVFLPVTGSVIPETDLVPYIPYILGLGVFGLGSLLTKTYSFRLGDASLVTSISYTMIIWAGLFDYFIWGRVPAFEVWIGALVIISSNLFIVWRERVKRKRELVEASNVGAD